MSRECPYPSQSLDDAQQSIWMGQLDFSNLDVEDFKNAPWRDLPVRTTKGALEFLKAHYAGRYVLSKMLNALNVSCTLKVNEEYGFLTLQGANTPLYVNISHSKTKALVGLSRYPIGVDIESIDRNVKKVLEKMCSQAELDASCTFQQANPTGNAALMLWCAKEAYSKALGIGIARGFKHFEILMNSKMPWSGKYRGSLKTLELIDPGICALEKDSEIIAYCSERSALSKPIHCWELPLPTQPIK